MFKTFTTAAILFLSAEAVRMGQDAAVGEAELAATTTDAPAAEAPVEGAENEEGKGAPVMGEGMEEEGEESAPVEGEDKEEGDEQTYGDEQADEKAGCEGADAKAEKEEGEGAPVEGEGMLSDQDDFDFTDITRGIDGAQDLALAEMTAADNLVASSLAEEQGLFDTRRNGPFTGDISGADKEVAGFTGDKRWTYHKGNNVVVFVQPWENNCVLTSLEICVGTPRYTASVDHKQISYSKMTFVHKNPMAQWACPDIEWNLFKGTECTKENFSTPPTTFTPYTHTIYKSGDRYNYAAGFKLGSHFFGQTEGADIQATTEFSGNIVGLKAVGGINLDYWGLVLAKPLVVNA